MNLYRLVYSPKIQILGLELKKSLQMLCALNSSRFLTNSLGLSNGQSGIVGC